MPELIRKDLEPLHISTRELQKQLGRMRRGSNQASEDQMIEAAERLADDLFEWKSMRRHPKEPHAKPVQAQKLPG